MNDANRHDKLGPAKGLYSFEHKGETYYFDFNTQRVKGVLEAWAISQAYAGLASRRGLMSDDDYGISLDTLNTRIDAGDYALDGGRIDRGADGKPVVHDNTIKRMLRTSDGVLKMVQTLLEKKHPKADRDLVIDMLSTEATAAVIKPLLERIEIDSAPKSDGQGQPTEATT